MTMTTPSIPSPKKPTFRFLRFGRKPVWVSYAELIGYGDGNNRTFQLPTSFTPRQRLCAYLAGGKVEPDGKMPEIDTR